jgi:hypothetical protein
MIFIYTESTLNLMLREKMNHEVEYILNTGEHRDRENKNGVRVKYVVLKEEDKIF